MIGWAAINPEPDQNLVANKKTLLFIVFTDLDGTLLDHCSYSHAAALPALTITDQDQMISLADINLIELDA